MVVPEEDAGQYHAGLEAWLADAQATGPIERALVQRAFHADCRLKRAARNEAASASFHARRAAERLQTDERSKAVEIVEKLIEDPINCCTDFQSHDPIVKARVDAWLKNDPAVLAPTPEETTEGVQSMLDRWEELDASLLDDEHWQYDARYRSILLTGRRQAVVMTDPVVTESMLACSVLHVAP